MSNDTRPESFPADARCRLCGHTARQHSFTSKRNFCNECYEDSFAAFRPEHRFMAIKLAGGALSASQEQDAYARAMRGEA